MCRSFQDLSKVDGWEIEEERRRQVKEGRFTWDYIYNKNPHITIQPSGPENLSPKSKRLSIQTCDRLSEAGLSLISQASSIRNQFKTVRCQILIQNSISGITVHFSLIALANSVYSFFGVFS
jgi:hypothetical protein